MIKAVFFDIDGTLFSHNLKDMPLSTRKAISKLKEKNIQCVIATGRHICEIEELPFHGIEFDGYITVNGHLCLNADKEVLYSHPMKGHDKDILIDIYSNNIMPLAIVERDGMFINYINDTVRQVKQDIMAPLPPHKKYEGADIYLAVGYIDTKQEEILRKRLWDCNIFRWHHHGVDIYSKNCDKVEGIKHYLELNHLTRDEIMVFGDGENDIGMLEYAGIGVAMGNANDKVKQASNYVTDHVDHDGIEKALKHYQIID